MDDWGVFYGLLFSNGWKVHIKGELQGNGNQSNQAAHHSLDHISKGNSLESNILVEPMTLSWRVWGFY